MQCRYTITATAMIGMSVSYRDQSATTWNCLFLYTTWQATKNKGPAFLPSSLMDVKMFSFRLGSLSCHRALEARFMNALMFSKPNGATVQYYRPRIVLSYALPRSVYCHCSAWKLWSADTSADASAEAARTRTCRVPRRKMRNCHVVRRSLLIANKSTVPDDKWTSPLGRWNVDDGAQWSLTTLFYGVTDQSFTTPAEGQSVLPFMQLFVIGDWEVI